MSSHSRILHTSWFSPFHPVRLILHHSLANILLTSELCKSTRYMFFYFSQRSTPAYFSHSHSRYAHFHGEHEFVFLLMPQSVALILYGHSVIWSIFRICVKRDFAFPKIFLLTFELIILHVVNKFLLKELRKGFVGNNPYVTKIVS